MPSTLCTLNNKDDDDDDDDTRFFFLKKRDEYFCWVGGLGKDGGQGYRMEYHR